MEQVPPPPRGGASAGVARRRWGPKRHASSTCDEEASTRAARAQGAVYDVGGGEEHARTSVLLCRADDGWQRQAGRACLRWAGSVSLTDAYLTQLPAGAVHLKGLFPADTWETGVVEECASAACIPWSQHEKTEVRGPWAKAVLDVLAASFGVEHVVETRVNVYRAGQRHAKPQHQDRNAFSVGAGDVTVGASFGASRTLEFRGLNGLDATFLFRQESGDVFAFDSTVNMAFTHGIRQEKAQQERHRVSVVLWGMRREGLGPVAATRPPVAILAPTGGGEEQQRPCAQTCGHSPLPERWHGRQEPRATAGARANGGRRPLAAEANRASSRTGA